MHIPDMQNPASRGYLKGLAHFAIAVGNTEKENTLTGRLRADGYTILSEKYLVYNALGISRSSAQIAICSILMADYSAYCFPPATALCANQFRGSYVQTTA